MKRAFPLQPEHTVTRRSHHLSARCPLALREDFFPLTKETNVSVSQKSRSCVVPGICFYAPRHRIPPHEHEHCELLFVLEGNAIHVTEHYVAPIRRHDVVFIGPRQVHGFEKIDGLHRISCTYLPEWLVHKDAELWSEPGLLPFLLAEEAGAGLLHAWVPHESIEDGLFARCLNVLRDIELETEQVAFSRAYLKRLLENLLILLGRAFSRGSRNSSFPVVRREIHSVLQRIEEHILSGEPFQTDRLSRESGFSERHLARVFRENLGISPMAYYQRRRIQHACWLLMHTDQSVTEIAHGLGFSDASHFIRYFHRERGESPKSYRERRGKNENQTGRNEVD